MDKLTDEQLKVLGTAIGAEIVRSFDSKQEYWYGSKGWLAKVAEKLGESIADNITSNIYCNENKFVAILKKVFGKD